MDAGSLNKRLTIEQPTRGRSNDLGEIRTAWEPVATVWASVTPLNARETIRAKAAEMTITHVVRMRYTPLVRSSDCRLTYTPAGLTPRILNITGVVNVGERNRELEIQAVEVA
jgi:SPP1 family predicted phage head-tail adaptor